MTTIAVPKQAEYEDAGKNFDEMATGLLTAADLTRNLHFQPGSFAEAERLQQAVDQFCLQRQDVLEIYSEACSYIGEIIRLCGETYTGSERERVDKGDTLQTRLGGAVQGLQRLHSRLDDVRRRAPTDPEPRYHIQDRASQANGRSMAYSQGSPLGPGPELSDPGTPPSTTSNTPPTRTSTGDTTSRLTMTPLPQATHPASSPSTTVPQNVTEPSTNTP